jgi:hypothetical protein
MPSATYPLDTFATATINAAGGATVPLGPGYPREHWQPGSAYVSVATNVNEASCVLFIGSSPQSATAIAQTSKGSSGATCAMSGDLPPGWKIWAVWSGGDTGSTATLHLTGQRTIGAPS